MHTKYTAAPRFPLETLAVVDYGNAQLGTSYSLTAFAAMRGQSGTSKLGRVGIASQHWYFRRGRRRSKCRPECRAADWASSSFVCGVCGHPLRPCRAEHSLARTATSALRASPTELGSRQALTERRKRTRVIGAGAVPHRATREWLARGSHCVSVSHECDPEGSLHYVRARGCYAGAPPSGSPASIAVGASAGWLIGSIA
jgi:hypothetical protein